MRYLVSGCIRESEARFLSHDEFREMVRKVLGPTATLLNQLQAEGKILSGGVRSAALEIFFILDMAGDSHMVVRKFLYQLPIHEFCDWEVTPLESFQDWCELLSV